ncbi:MAG: hypothetical protein K8I27_07140 [Planctomycetes bacterium]|nr:hypothetical protein [Planctomycetota bacterium]
MGKDVDDANSYGEADFGPFKVLGWLGRVGTSTEYDPEKKHAEQGFLAMAVGYRYEIRFEFIGDPSKCSTKHYVTSNIEASYWDSSLGKRVKDEIIMVGIDKDNDVRREDPHSGYDTISDDNGGNGHDVWDQPGFQPELADYNKKQLKALVDLKWGYKASFDFEAQCFDSGATEPSLVLEFDTWHEARFEETEDGKYRMKLIDGKAPEGSVER